MTAATADAVSQVPAWSLWVPVIAALGAALLAGFATWSVGEWQRRKQAKTQAAEARASAYQEFMIYSFDFIHRTQAIGQMVRLRSGLAEGLAVTMRQRKPVDLLDLFEWLDVAMRPLAAAWLSAITKFPKLARL